MAQVTQGRTVQGAAVVDVHITEVAINDSDKTFTVPADETWEVLLLRYEYTASATAGTRTPTIRYQDDNSDDILLDVAGATITQGNSSTQLADASGTLDLTIPQRLVLHPGYDIRVFDSAAIDAAADDMVVHLFLRIRA